MATGRGYHMGPSPNWYCPHISDCNPDGLFAYGARHEVVILRTSVDPPIFELIQNVHSDRVTAVAFSKTSDSVLATASDDCFIKIWNVEVSEGNQVSLTQDNEFKLDQKISCVTWQHESKTVFAADSKVNIWAWDTRQDAAKQLKTEIRSQPTVLASCPHKVDHLAVGYKGGILAILDVSKKGTILMKLKGHEDDIISLAWSPEPAFKGNDSLDLASTSRDRSLRVWNLEKERYIHMVKIPQAQTHNKNLVDSNNKNRLWVTCLWVPEVDNRILCTTITGELMQVELNPEKKPFWVTLDTKEAGGHNRCIFNISICNNILCSVSLDRQIVVYDLRVMKSTYCISTLGGFAHCLSFSPIDVGRLAVGCADKTVRIWRTSSNSSPYSATMLWQGINGKVTNLAWHPTKENQLAFGTDEGHVGVLDASGGKQPVICKTYHRHIVYTLCWGPFRKSSESEKCLLYSCGDGNILVHDPSHKDKEAVNLNDVLTPKSSSKKSEVAWKQDYTALAVGCEDGSVEIYSDEFQLLAVLKAQKHLIQCLRWHPISTSLNPVSVYQHYLASSSYDTVIHVYDLTEILDGERMPSKVVTQSNIQLVGHTSRVNSLSWSPYIDGQLSSASYDGSVQLWNATTMEPIGNYRGHRGLVFCVQWSATDPEILFSGGDDLSVQQFSSTSLTDKLPPPKKSKKNKKPSQKPDQAEDPTTDNSTSQHCNGEVTEEANSASVGVIIVTQATSTTAAPGQSKKKKKKVLAAQKSGFPICNSLDARGKDGMLEDIKVICREYKRARDPEKTRKLNKNIEPPDFKTSPNLGFFLRSVDFKKTQAVEENGHKETGNSELLFQIALWRGDIEGVLREAANQGQLSDYLVSLAPLGCRALWLEMCHKYALQLEKEENYAKAANYFLACHKVYEAVDMLISQHCFREALALAKGRFPESDPIFERIHHAWAAKAEKDGNYELVAKCHLALGELARAARCLTKRNDAQSHAVAAYISAQDGIVLETEDCIISCIHQALTRNEWDIARAMLNEQKQMNLVSNLQPLYLVVTVHEFLTSSLKEAQKQTNPSPLGDMLECKSGQIWKGKLLKGVLPESVCEKPFLDQLREMVSTEEKIILDGSLGLLRRLGGQRSLSSREIIYETAVGLTQYLLADSEVESMVYLSKVLGTNYSAEPEYTILNFLCKLLFPFDLSLPVNSKQDCPRSFLGLSLEELVKDAFMKPGSKSKGCNAESSVIGFFAANLLDCMVQEASKLPKSTFLKHPKDCENCATVVENLTSVVEVLSGLLRQEDFHKYETLSTKLKKLDEQIAKLSATPRVSSVQRLEELQQEKTQVQGQMDSLPGEVQRLPYPKNSLVCARAKELCKQLALAVQCSKTIPKIRGLAEKF